MRLSDGDADVQETGSGLGFWALLTREERRALSALGRDRNYPPGAIMCVEGDPATHVFILVDGWVKVLSVTRDGHELVRALRGQGDIIGEIAGETTGYRTATVKAVDLVRALIVGYDRFSTFLDANPGAAHAYRRVMMQRWSDADAMLRRHPVTSGAQRLAGVLLDLAGRHGTITDGRVDVAMPLTQAEMASLAGTSRATVARALNNWRKRGFVSTGQKHITINNPQSLRQIAS